MALVLLYHRIAELGSDPQRLAVSPKNFSRQLEILRERCNPVPLRTLTEGAPGARLPDRTVAVTFDDGYADNLENGKPLLECCEMSATVFLATAYLGSGREFWWDDLERLLLLPGQLPRTLRLRIGGSVREWDLNTAHILAAEDCDRHADWHVERREDPTPRHHVYRSLCGLLRMVSSEEREVALQELSDAAEGIVSSRATHRALEPDEVVRLIEGNTIDVGAHTATHSALSGLPVDRQRAEIAGSKARLQEMTQREVTAFAYPFGTRGDYTRTSVRLVREAGFRYAFSAVPGLVGTRSDPFQLPRVLVRNWDGDTFAGRLEEWLGHA